MKRFTSLAVCLVLALSLSGQASPPGQSKAYGKTLSEWMKLYWTWYLGGDQADHVDNVRFMPLPAGVATGGDGSNADPYVFTGNLDVNWTPGTPFVLPVIVFYGERYLDDSTDPVMNSADFITGTDILVKVDGKTVINSATQDL